MSLSDFYNYGRIQVYFPNQVTRMIRLVDLVHEIIDAYGSQSQVHSAIATYTFRGFTENDPPIDPGSGNMVFNTTGEGLGTEYQLIMNITDQLGYDLGNTLTMLEFSMDIYDLWLFIHSKRDPAIWMGGIIYDVTGIEDEEEREVAYSFYWIPLIGSEIWNEEEGESEAVVIPDDDEVILTFEWSGIEGV
jgi:hypothetical protein